VLHEIRCHTSRWITLSRRNNNMLSMWTAIQARFTNEEEGASLVEYALLVALIAVVAIIAITFVGDQVSENFSEIGSGLDGV
jgi:pilus assembly protein Flp/PilA